MSAPILTAADNWLEAVDALDYGDPWLIDGCACEGCATAGYQRAGFRVVAVDSDRNRLKYNPAEVRIHADLYAVLADRELTRRMVAAHISPPCQWYTAGRRAHRGVPSRWERTIPPMREAVEETGLVYVLENVADAGWDMREPTRLCGCMFGLSALDFTCTSPGQHEGVCDTEDGVTVHLQRPRLFEASFPLAAPRPCDHSAHDWVAGAYGGARRDKYEAKFIRHGGYVPPEKAVVAELLGVEHQTTWQGLYESIPPAYSQHVGTQLLAHIEGQAAA